MTRLLRPSLFNIGLFLWVLPAINRRPLEPIDTEEGDRHPRAIGSLR